MNSAFNPALGTLKSVSLTVSTTASLTEFDGNGNALRSP
jgi:hypothetical protein